MSSPVPALQTHLSSAAIHTDLSSTSFGQNFGNLSLRSADWSHGSSRYPTNDFVPLVVKIVATQSVFVPETQKHYTAYHIEVFSQQSGCHPWIVRRRYSQFQALHIRVTPSLLPANMKLRQRLGSRNIPDIPEPKVFGVMEPEFVEQRRIRLQV
jgi:hypothetical protein